VRPQLLILDRCADAALRSREAIGREQEGAGAPSNNDSTGTAASAGTAAAACNGPRPAPARPAPLPDSAPRAHAAPPENRARRLPSLPILKTARAGAAALCFAVSTAGQQLELGEQQLELEQTDLGRDAPTAETTDLVAAHDGPPLSSLFSRGSAES